MSNSTYYVKFDPCAHFNTSYVVREGTAISDKRVKDVMNFLNNEIYEFNDRNLDFSYYHGRFNNSEATPNDILFMMNNSMSLRRRTFTAGFEIYLFEVVKDHFIALISTFNNISKENLIVLFLTYSGDRILMSTYGYPCPKFLAFAKEISLFWDDEEALENCYEAEEELEIVMKDYFVYLYPIRSEAMAFILLNMMRKEDTIKHELMYHYKWST